MYEQHGAPPLSAERLAEIRALMEDTERARARLTEFGGTEWQAQRPRAPMVEAANTLLAEVERLRDENASYRPIVEQVATLSPIVAWGSDFREICGCCYGHREASDIDQGIEEVDESAIIHAPGCPVLHARAILGREDEA